MVNIAALMKALPVSGLEPANVALLGGFIDAPKDRSWQEHIWLLEPPAGQHIPYIEPMGALEKLLRRQGIAPEDAKARALEAMVRMKKNVQEAYWVNFFDDYEPESPECLPLPRFVGWLREECRRAHELTSLQKPDAQGIKEAACEVLLVPPDILDFFEQAEKVTTSTPMFRGPDNRDDPWSLESLPALPPPKAMIEFVPGPPWADHDDGNWVDDPSAYYPIYTPFQRWREMMRPIAQELETVLGEPVYYFANLASDIDDDDVHRFLVLHWCCTHKPESAFVRYLLKSSGARDVEELKAALIDPCNYKQPFEMNSAFIGLEATPCVRIDYLPPEAHRTVGVVFQTEQARKVAQSLLEQQIGAHAFIIAPKDLATSAWVKQATRTCREWTVRHVDSGKLDEPIDILASVDKLCVIANEPTPNCGFDLKLPNPMEDLLWLALDLGVEARYYHIDRMQLANPDVSLEKRGVSERVAAQRTHREAFTRQLKEIRLANDFSSSGLWDDEGRSLGYDLLDLPFPLVCRIAAWQRDYDATMKPPGKGDKTWRKRHEQEALDLARALQMSLGGNTEVKLHCKQGWMSADEVVDAEIEMKPAERKSDKPKPQHASGRSAIDQTLPTLTEEDAVTAFAKAWNRLEPDPFLSLLAPNARYASQWVFEELVGAAAIADYLRGKMRTVRAHGVNNPGSRVRVEIGRTAHGDGGRPCAFMTQGRDNTVQAVVLFEIGDHQVLRYDLCIPQILGAVRTGVFPI